jgi:protein-tyrosine-phosphatase/DNA-binding HxlR family transcriptional regulator
LTNEESSAIIASMSTDIPLTERAAIHAALSDPHRLEIVDELAVSDRSPTELGDLLGLGSNLLAHHLRVLEAAEFVERLTSAGDGRRRYVRLIPGALSAIAEPILTIVARQVLFVCTANSARSQLAAAIWNANHEVPATSAGTHPAERVHPGAIAAASRAGLDLSTAQTRSVEHVDERPDLVVTVCDVAREEYRGLGDGVRVLHWSIPDPARSASPSAFDVALRRIGSRVDALTPHVRPPRAARRSHR